MNLIFLDQVRSLLAGAALVLTDPRPRDKFRNLGWGLLCGPQPKTIASALEWLDQRQEDWSADYRLFSQAHWDSQALLEPVFHQALASSACGGPRVYTGQDDTLARKTGKKTPGVAYARDPLSPACQVNLVLGQRFVQTSLLLQPGGPDHPWRALPVSFTHAPVPKIPQRGTPEAQAAGKELRKKHRLAVVALEQLHYCRQQLDRQPGGAAHASMALTCPPRWNRSGIRTCPGKVARCSSPAKSARWNLRNGPTSAGLKRPKPGPCACSSSKRPAILRCTQDRLCKGGKLLYREPAFLTTTDRTTPAAELIAAYLARWEVAVNFRDEKTLLGVGQAQVRSPQSVARAPAFLVACYSMLLWSSMGVFGDQRTAEFESLPAWRNLKPARLSTRDLIRLLQRQAAEANLTPMRN